MTIQKRFKILDTQYFNGRFARLGYKLVLRDKLLTGGRFDRPGRRILLKNNNERILLHEMCHLASSYHGQKFQAELRRLARLGVPEMQAELELYSGPKWYLTKNDIGDMALDAVFTGRETSYYSARRCLAHQNGFTASRFDRRFPWAAKAWKENVAECHKMLVADRKFLG